MTDNIEFSIGDFVFCTHEAYYGVSGRVIKKYVPTACEEQTMIETPDGRLFHAPTRVFLKIG
uniref:Exoribonuclease n=1 Tax=Siphoviridae sp. ct0uL16 TaxID=2825299 RepID=A0A8S5Q4L1_9CAUD|nr:MAG TPA: exoribonuclease [Siphoviridae sp. ct0uL16]